MGLLCCDGRLPAVLHILLALSTGERYGYGIMKQVQADSQGKAKMGPETLYGSMGRMMEVGLIRESDKRVDPEMDERRIYYELTGAGRAELERYRGVVAVAEGRLAYGPRAALPNVVYDVAAAVSAALP